MAATSILAIECATDSCSVALCCAGQSWQVQERLRDKHSETLLPMVAEVLRQSGHTGADLSLLAAGIGPGSFTGVRTAVSVAQGLALGWNLPLIGVGTLEALALACASTRTTTTRVVALLDARMHEVYASVMDVEVTTCTVSTVQQPAVMPPEQVAAWLATQIDMVAGCNCDAYLPALESLPGTRVTGMPHALQIAQIAQTRFRDALHHAPELCQPLYVRDRVALTIKEREQIGQAA